ncbi:hypothetical protein JCM14076_20080 [Methylosoma difficile]
MLKPSLAALTLMMLTATAHAAPVSFQYKDTIALVNIAGLNTGDNAKITVTLDNGGTSLLNQTWTAADLLSVKFDFNNGFLSTTYLAPFGGDGVDAIDGDFTTDASGILSSVLTTWIDYNPGTDYSGNGSSPDSWFLYGNNSVYYQGSGEHVDLANVSAMSDAANWQIVPTATPIPAGIWLLLSGFATLKALGGKRRRA